VVDGEIRYRGNNEITERDPPRCLREGCRGKNVGRSPPSYLRDSCRGKEGGGESSSAC
jgi:hypothetical protein